MKTTTAILATTFSLLLGCGSEDGGLDVIRVSEMLAPGANYNIDLTREDAIYFLDPALDQSQIQVTCPTLATLSFAQYLELRIRPTGSIYDPIHHELWLVNGEVPENLVDETIGQSTLALSAAAVAAQCVNVCVDDADGNEECVCRGGAAQ